MVNSVEKGKRVERELARKINEQFGTECRRAQQYCGANGDADVVGLEGVHVECKRVESLNIHKAVTKAVGDAREGDTPAVFHRKNGTEWLVTTRLGDLVEFVEKIAKIVMEEVGDE